MIRKVSLPIGLIVIGILLLVFFPYNSFYDFKIVSQKMDSVTTSVPELSQLDAYLTDKERAFPHLRKDLGRAITWYDKTTEVRAQTEYSFVYLPGFTATKKEISPVVEVLAKQFKANSYFSRLPSHGEEADDFARARAEDFFENTMEAVLIGEKIGKKPIYVGLSTGASLLQYVLNRTQTGYAFVGFSPAFFSQYHYMNVSLNPWVGLGIVKWIVGNYYEWKPHFPTQELYWNTKYKTDILPQITRVFQIVSKQDYSQFKIPNFLIYSANDTIINHDLMLQKWLQTTNPFNKKLALNSRDPHVVAGDITSPENTNPTIEAIANWINQLGNPL